MEEICLRLYGRRDYDPLEELVEAFGHPEVLVVEGTNLGRLITPLEPKDFLKIIDRILSGGPAIVSLHTFDLESLLAISAIGRKHGLSTYVYGARIALYLSSTGIEGKLLRELGLAYTGRKLLPTVSLDGVPLGEALRDLLDGKSLIVTDFESVDIVRAIREYSLAKSVSAVLVVSEPHTEEYSIELKKQIAWFRKAGIQPYRVRVSGHYYPYEIRRILGTIKPKRVVPVHTMQPEIISAVASKYDIRIF